MYCNDLFKSMRLKRTGYEFIIQESLYYILRIILEPELYIIKNIYTQKSQDRVLQLKKGTLFNRVKIFKSYIS